MIYWCFASPALGLGTVIATEESFPPIVALVLVHCFDPDVMLKL